MSPFHPTDLSYTEAILEAAKMAVRNRETHVDSFVTVRVDDLSKVVERVKAVARSDGDTMLAIPTKRGVELISCCPRNGHIWKLSVEQAAGDEI